MFSHFYRIRTEDDCIEIDNDNLLEQRTSDVISIMARWNTNHGTYFVIDGYGMVVTLEYPILPNVIGESEWACFLSAIAPGVVARGRDGEVQYRDHKTDLIKLFAKGQPLVGEGLLPVVRQRYHYPYLSADGTFIDTPGLTGQTWLYEHSWEPIPVRDSIEIIRDAFDGTLFDGDESYANALASAFTPILRNYTGPAPLTLITKPQPGCGGSALAQLCSIIGTSRYCRDFPAFSTGEEFAKGFASVVQSYTGVCRIDNLSRRLVSDLLAQSISSDGCTTRVLGQPHTMMLDTSGITWQVTANAGQLGSDFSRRTILVNLIPKQANMASYAWPRNHSSYIRDNATLLHQAALSIVQSISWPDMPEFCGREYSAFQKWMDAMALITALFELPLPDSNSAVLLENNLSYANYDQEFMQTWADLDAPRASATIGKTSSELFHLTEQSPYPGQSERSAITKFGIYLNNLCSRIFEIYLANGDLYEVTVKRFDGRKRTYSLQLGKRVEDAAPVAALLPEQFQTGGFAWDVGRKVSTNGSDLFELD